MNLTNIDFNRWVYLGLGAYFITHDCPKLSMFFIFIGLIT